MFTLSTLILAIAIAVVVGGLIGALLLKGLSPQEKQNRSLETRLQKAENQMREYQQDVSEHFAQTSELINTLTQSYRDVHEHLATGALKLTNPDISRQLIDAGKGNLMISSSHSRKAGEEDESGKEPPRDWAPRNPGDKGQLSEEFGFESADNEVERPDKVVS